MLREAKLVRYPFGNYWWQEVNPHEYQIRRADPAQTVIGRLVEIPAHGRDKGKWVLPDANQEYSDSQSAVAGLEIWHKLDVATTPPTSAPVSAPPAASTPEPSLDTTGYLNANEAAVAYGISRNEMMTRLKAGQIPGVQKVPHGNRAGFRYLVLPPAPVIAEEIVAPPPVVPPSPAPKAKPTPPPALQNTTRERDLWAEISRLQEARREDAITIGRLQAQVEQLQAEVAHSRKGLFGGLFNGHTSAKIGAQP